MVPLVKGEWAEVRTLAVGEPEERQDANGKRETHVINLSYFSRLTSASTFTDLAIVEMQRRGVLQAKQVAAVMDGAEWLPPFTDMHRSDAVRILDFPHAAEHLTQLLEALEQAGLRFPPQMLERCLHVLKHRGPRPLLRMAERLSDEVVQQKGVREHLGYLRKRDVQMQYPQFQRNGWPIGSGMVESANKNVVEARLKGPGMHWERRNVNPMLALRNAVCNQRWRETWQKAVLQYQKQEALLRTKREAERKVRAEQRKLAFLPATNPSHTSSPSASLPIPSPVPPVSQSSPLSPVPAATLPGSSRPSPHHPWKRGPACSPKTFAKI